MLENFNLEEAQRILAELQRMHEELQLISAAGDRLKHSRGDEVEHFATRLKLIKADIKEAAKTGTIDRKKRPMTSLESAYFDGAVRHASANFHLRTDAPPSKWVSGLYEPAADLSFVIFNLEKRFEDG